MFILPDKHITWCRYHLCTFNLGQT